MYFTDKSLQFVFILSKLQTSPTIIATFVPYILYERVINGSSWGNEACQTGSQYVIKY